MQISSDSNIVTDLDAIHALLRAENEHILLYDTGAIARHENGYHATDHFILDTYNLTSVVFMTETIYNELNMDDKFNLRYQIYLDKFDSIAVIAEEDFFSFFSSVITNQHKAFSLMVHAAKKAFQLLPSLKQRIEQCKDYTDLHRSYNQYFIGSREKNKGEFSLLFLSNLLLLAYPNKKHRFISIDKDVYDIVDNCYLRQSAIREQIAENVKRDVSIFSTDTLLSSDILEKRIDDTNYSTLFQHFRQPERKVMYKVYERSILTEGIKSDSFSNDEFLNKVRKKDIQVIY
ncbi:hypothetical protein ABC345_21400 [Shouchella sp. 1P09AA]|uniref:hypothetical protein n=1 Tax=unclassified Shouchella TaxID=2893065 RepID=UPI0039A2DF27